MVPLYKHTVRASNWFGWLLGLPLVGALLVLALNPTAAALWVVLSLGFGLGGVYWVFHRIDLRLLPSGVLYIALAGGWIVRRVNLSKVTSWGVASPSLFWGWGLRFTGRGWMYRIGQHPVLCFYLSNGEELLLATDDLPGLTAALQRFRNATE